MLPEGLTAMSAKAVERGISDAESHFDLSDAIRSAPGRIAVALAYGNFRLLWIGALTSSIGTWMQRVAQAWLIVTMTGSRSAFLPGIG